MNVLITSTTFIPSVLLCGHCQLDYLEKQGKLNYKFVIAHFINKRNVEWADIIVFLRSDSDIESYVCKLAKKTHKHTVYVLDDDLLNAPSYVSSFPYYNLPSTKNNMKTIMANCDTFLTPSPVLLEKYGKTFKNKFLISEPSLNRITKKQGNDKIKVGFAGSIDRAQDLNQILEGAITKLVEKYGDSIDIEFFGAKPEFVDKLNLKYIPYQDGYDAYTAYMAKCNWDIGLAPMPDTPFHRCKYFNKYVEYASFGIAGVYSNLEPYTFGIKDKVNGLLVNNTTEDWVEGISKLIDDEKLRKEISNTCIKEANETYALDVLAKDYLEKITVGYKGLQVKPKIGSLEPAKFVIFWKRVFRKIKEQGLNFPSWFKKKLDKKINERKEEIRHNKNKEKLKEIIKNNKTVCVISPMFDDSNDEYNKRVKLVDEGLGDSFRIYLSGEDRLAEHLEVDFVDDSHATIIYNSFDILQTEEVLKIIELSKNCLIHSVIRFMREKISTDMFKLFDLADVNKIWDSHGAIPEMYHEALNYHTEKVTNEIEEVFYNKSDLILVDDEKLIDHFNNKYNSNKKIVVYNSKTTKIL